MSRRYDHVHIYKAINSDRKLYRCQIPECPHSERASALIGRKAHCPECNTDLIITEEHLRRINITCIGCGRKGFAKNFKHGPPEAPESAIDILKKMSI